LGLLPTGRVNSVIVPLVVMRPIALAPRSLNQRLPSGPRVIVAGMLPAFRPVLNS